MTDGYEAALRLAIDGLFGAGTTYADDLLALRDRGAPFHCRVAECGGCIGLQRTYNAISRRKTPEYCDDRHSSLQTSRDQRERMKGTSS
jgi:hypothetical protein